MEPTFGERLSCWLRFVGMRPASLARELGVSRTAIHNWTTGVVAPGTDRIGPIARALKITEAEFFGRLPELAPLATPAEPATPVEEEAGPVTREMTRVEIDAALDRNEECPTCGHTTEAA